MDETKVTPEAEKIAPVVEGTVEAEVAKVETPVVDTKKPDDTVPLSVYLDLKKDLKDLKHEIKESGSKSNERRVEVQGLSELTSKYPDVSPEFISDMLSSATKEATKKIEEKYSPIIEKQENEKKQAAFDRAFDNLYEKTLQDNPDLPKSIDKDVIKELALTPKYRNVPLADILIKMYGNTPVGKPSSETETRSASDVVEDVVSFDKITNEQKNNIMKDPKAKKAYFNWLDSQNR